MRIEQCVPISQLAYVLKGLSLCVVRIGKETETEKATSTLRRNFKGLFIYCSAPYAGSNPLDKP